VSPTFRQPYTIDVIPVPVVPKTTPVITWPAPASITYGSALSATQLNATAIIPGTFVYSPPAGTVLPVGSQTLSVTFAPSDTDHYNTASATTNITVNPAPSVPSGKPNLVVTNSLSRSTPQLGSLPTLFVRLRVANTGAAPAHEVTLYNVKVGPIPTTPLSQNLGTISPGAALDAVFQIVGISIPTGTATSLSISGAYTGGTISSSARIVAP
jgi:hypothetical protein